MHFVEHDFESFVISEQSTAFVLNPISASYTLSKGVLERFRKQCTARIMPFKGVESPDHPVVYTRPQYKGHQRCLRRSLRVRPAAQHEIIRYKQPTPATCALRETQAEMLLSPAQSRMYQTRYE